MGSDVANQLNKHLDEAYAMEKGVLRMLDSMLKTTHDEELRRELEAHKRTTRNHADRLRERLRANGARPSGARQAGGLLLTSVKTVVDVTRPQKPGRNARDGFATEQMEVAAYELLERIARHAGDNESAEVARKNRNEDEAMARVIARNWDKVADASLADGTQGASESSRPRQSAKRAAGLARNPVALGVGSALAGLLLGRRLQTQPRQTTNGARQGTSDTQPLRSLQKTELQERARQSGIEVKASMTKQDLINALEGSRRSSGTGPANPIEVQKFLEGVGYPKTRDQLVKEAERREANERVITTLSQLPRKQYRTPTEVSEALGASS
jgi:ferritin-like metal-binding protein YciE